MHAGWHEGGWAFEFSGFFTVILGRFNLNKDVIREFSLNDKRAERIVTILRQLVVHQSLDIEQVAMELSTSARTIRNDVGLLVAKDWVDSSGSSKGRSYRLTGAGQEWMSRRM